MLESQLLWSQHHPAHSLMYWAASFLPLPLPILLFALVLQLVLLAMAMTQTLVLFPPTRNIGFVRRRRSMIVGLHLGCSTSLRFLLSMRLIKFNCNKMVMLDKDVTKLQVQIEITSVGLQLLVVSLLRIHQRSYGLGSMRRKTVGSSPQHRPLHCRQSIPYEDHHQGCPKFL